MTKTESFNACGTKKVCSNEITIYSRDQLNIHHPWFKTVDTSVCFVLMEMRQETDYAPHHIQKVVAFFGAMRNFAQALESKGHQVSYLTLDDPQNKQNLNENLSLLIEQMGATSFEYQLPDEYRLDEQLKDFCQHTSVETQAVDTHHFMTKREDLAEFFEGKKQLILEFFYRNMRKQFNLLMQQGQPEGGQWNYDKNNRKKWKGTPSIPLAYIPKTEELEALQRVIEAAGVKTIGKMDTQNFLSPLVERPWFSWTISVNIYLFTLGIIKTRCIPKKSIFFTLVYHLR